MGVGSTCGVSSYITISYVDSSGNITKDIDDYVQFESGILSNSSVFDKPPADLAEVLEYQYKERMKNIHYKYKYQTLFLLP